MKKMTRHSVLALAAAMILTACTGGSKPFEELGSYLDEFAEATVKTMKELNNASGLKDAEERMAESLKPYMERGKKVMKNLDGTEIETTATEETGITVEKGFTVTSHEDGDNNYLTLEAKVAVDEEAQPEDVIAIGYDGETPVLYFAGNRYYYNNSLEINKEEGTLSFKLSASPTDGKLLAIVEKIVLTTDKALADSLKEDQSKREKELWEALFQ